MKTNQTYYWPAWFRQTLTQSEKKQINPKLIRKLGSANLYLWRAYNIYDDIIDTGTARDRLPEANDYHRKFLEIYYRLNLGSDFYKLFDTVIRDLEQANRTEILQNRLNIHDGKIIYPVHWPDFTDLTALARKSLALGLGPVAILYLLNGKNKRLRIKYILDFFRFALAARQLADDAYDWLDDLKNNSITAANIHVLKQAKRQKMVLKLNSNIAALYSLFITSASVAISQDLRLLCNQARLAANKAFLAQNCHFVNSILMPLEKNIAETDDRRSLLLKKYVKML